MRAIRVMSRIGGSVFFLAMLSLAFSLTASAPASARNSTQTLWEGEPICGGVNLKTGKSTEPCGFTKAKKQGAARKSCPGGSFFDLGTWSCYSCPRGYNRTANPIDGEAACSQAVRKQFLRARFHQKYNRCPSGSFFDPRNGGECWRCPSGFGRTAAAVHEWNACGKAFARARSAELVATVCPRGTFGDPRNGGECWTCPAGYLRSSFPVHQNKACYRTEVLSAATRSQDNICQKDALFDLIDGGTCWTCPEDSVRTVFGVKSNEACEYSEIRWNPPKREAKSLFHIPGGDGVTRAVVAERTLIEKVSRQLAKQAKVNADKALAADWELIKKAPHGSAVLIGAVYARVLELIKSGAKTKDERDLLAYFARYVQDTRRLNAIQIRDVYESWDRNKSARRAAQPGAKAIAIYDVGTTPPDLNKVVHGVMGITATGMMFGGSALMVSKASAVGFQAMATHKGALGGFAKAIFPYVKKLTLTVAQHKAGMTQAALLSSVAAPAKMVAAVSGPLVVLTGAAITAGLAIDVVAKNEQAKAKIEDALKIAERKVDLKRLLLSKEGETELLTNWMIMTQATTAPRVPFPVAKFNYSGPATIGPGEIIQLNPGGGLAGDKITIEEQKVIAAATAGNVLPSKNWVVVPGNARDVAIGKDGTAFVIGTNQQKGGFGIFKRAKGANKWTTIPGAAMRITAEGASPWVINADGKVFSHNGKKWVSVKAPKAADIGASSGGGVWIVGADEKIYRRDGGNWRRVSGTALRIDVDRNGTPWVVNTKGDVYLLVNNKWRQAKGRKAVDVSVDAPGLAKIVGQDGRVYTRNGNKWARLSDNNIVAGIGIGDGQIWGVGKGTRIFRMK